MRGLPRSGGHRAVPVDAVRRRPLALTWGRPTGKASARETNDAAQATGAPAPQAGARSGQPVAGGHSGSRAAGGSGARGPEAGRVGAQGLAATFDSQQRGGPSHLRPQTRYRPSRPGLF